MLSEDIWYLKMKLFIKSGITDVGIVCETREIDATCELCPFVFHGFVNIIIWDIIKIWYLEIGKRQEEFPFCQISPHSPTVG